MFFFILSKIVAQDESAKCHIELIVKCLISAFPLEVNCDQKRVVVMSYSHKEPVRKIIYSIFLSRGKKSLFWLFDFVMVGGEYLDLFSWTDNVT